MLFRLFVLLVSGAALVAQNLPRIESETISFSALGRRVRFLNNQFVVGGQNGEILWSSDGFQWSGTTSGRNNRITELVFADGKYYALQSSDLLVSSNLWQWQRLTNALEAMDALLHQDGVFTAARRWVQQSTNGVDWVTVRSNATPALSVRAMAYGNERFVGVGEAFRGWSLDGRSWTVVTNAPRPGSFWEVTFAQGVFVAAGTGVHWSTNGQDWVASMTTPTFSGVTYGGGKFVAVGDYGELFYSTDGKEWTETPRLHRGLIHSVAYGNGRFVAVGWGPTLVSLDGVAWQESFAASTDMRGFIDFGGELYATGVYRKGEFTRLSSSSTNYVGLYRSADGGETWALQPTSLPTGISDLKNHGEMLVATGHDAMVAVSTNTQTWDVLRLGDFPWRTSAVGNGLHVLVGGVVEAKVGLSANAKDWTVLTPTNVPGMLDVAFGNGRFVTVGSHFTTLQGCIASSTDGRTWTTHLADYPKRLRSIVYGNGRFVAGGNDGALLTSHDGVTWKAHEKVMSGTLVNLQYRQGLFLALGTTTAPANDITIWSSVDGEKWRASVSPNVSPRRIYFPEAQRSRVFFGGSRQTAPLEPWLKADVDAQGRLGLRGVLAGPRTHVLQASDDLVTWENVDAIAGWSEEDGLQAITQPEGRKGFYRLVRRVDRP